MNVDVVAKSLTSPSIESSIREGLEGWDGAEPAAIERTMAWFRAIRDNLIALLRDVDDEDQIDETLAINYIELKSRWIALNTKINYQTFRLGSCDPELAFQGSAISILLGEVESLLTPRDIEQITEFLAQPIRRAA
jgi:hypothetical protein